MELADALSEVEKFKNFFRALEKIDDVVSAMVNANQVIEERKQAIADLDDKRASVLSAFASEQADMEDNRKLLAADIDALSKNKISLLSDIEEIKKKASDEMLKISADNAARLDSLESDYKAKKAELLSELSDLSSQVEQLKSIYTEMKDKVAKI